MLDPKSIVDAFHATVAPLEAELTAAKTGLEALVQEAAGLRAANEQQILKVTALTEELRVVTAQRDRAWARDEKYKADLVKYETEVAGLRKELDALAVRVK